MKKTFIFGLVALSQLVFGEVAHEPKIDELYWDKGWIKSDLYIRTNNNMWWKVISFEESKPNQWQIGDGVMFSKYPFEHPCQYWLVNLNHFGGVIVEYQYEQPVGFFVE